MATKSLLMDEAIKSERKDRTNTVILRLQNNRTNAWISQVHDNKVGKAQQGKAARLVGRCECIQEMPHFQNETTKESTGNE